MVVVSICDEAEPKEIENDVELYKAVTSLINNLTLVTVT